MTVAISDAWKRVEDWLAEHAPALRAELAPPADSARIVEVERAIGRPLLRPVVASPARHDGFHDWRASLLPGFYRLLSAREIVAEWRSLTGSYDRCAADEAGDEVDDDFTRIGSSALLYGHPQVIPLARDMCGSHPLVDHRPVGDRGRVTQPRRWKASYADHTRCGRPCRS
ncbi:hypothetical protein ACIRP0_22540 [Streptomyces sp. NPDC101733]|uniref:SMI1/KNR4 family protein n=1 Tax=unclassified Streptomyces TaxID=2593676 RepID=UPI003816D211